MADQSTWPTWIHLAIEDVKLRDQLRFIPSSLHGISAFDLLEALLGIIDAQQQLIEGQKEAIRSQDILLGTYLKQQD